MPPSRSAARPSPGASGPTVPRHPPRASARRATPRRRLAGGSPATPGGESKEKTHEETRDRGTRRNRPADPVEHPSLAQSAPDYAALDTNADGAVSLAEVKAALPDLTDEQIIAADADQDGNLSTEEYTALTAG